MSVDSALKTAEAAIDFPQGHPLYRYGKWRLNLRGPWHLTGGVRYQAIAEPHNATGEGLNRPIEGLGATWEEALDALIVELERLTTSEKTKERAKKAKKES